MDDELAEIADFLAAHPPFSELPEQSLQALPRELTVRYYRRGSVLATPADEVKHLSIVRAGAVDVHDAAGALVERVDVGGSFGVTGLVQPPPYGFSVTALEDTLILELPASSFHRLVESSAAFSSYFLLQQAHRLHAAVQSVAVSDSGTAVLKTRLRDMVTRPPVAIGPQASVQEAAQLMRSERISSLLVQDPQVVGIVTDRDLRNRVLADGLPPSTPVAQIMTPNPTTADADTLAFELLLSMLARGIHHVPVTDGQDLLGIITSTDLVRLEQSNPLYVVQDISRQNQPEDIALATARLPDLVERLVAQDASAEDIGRVVTAVADAVQRRLLILAEEKLGPPPVPYCWVALGSQGRREQALGADQDHALILSDDVTREHDAYFADLAGFVRDGLVTCGYPPCPGDVMATTPRWRQPLATWRRQFGEWISEPTPDAVLAATIFFDMRAVAGELELCTRLRTGVLAMTPNAKIFLAHLAKQAVEHAPPIGMFRGLVLEKEGEHKSTLDLKHRGVGPVVDLARVAALAAGLPQVGTQARLDAVAAAGGMSAAATADLKDALEFIAYVRLRHQARQVRERGIPDNFVSPEELSSFEKRHLRDAFGVVRTAQGVLAGRHPLGYIS
ncbi:DUF294 nucleotidyltransferase-like domain-containing protein [Gephyromycinifex aptenodytis]|uniref:DUF294 nucleotidyltransferase-like domain-containing protein n=1 Tax=Gephyromycinifex aptenodytis TaxID=2716227 RepID=UPI0014485D80|nr:DUF294 nucleotidyltransferase-like domain-containing protein [Gephyromycinifex aptenodytis]